MSLLLTSFTTWLPHQKSNASDDLLKIITRQDTTQYYFLRQLPVNVNLATIQTITAIKKFQPQGIICCGMVESRQYLTLESQASYQGNYLL
jgi:pyroglutamyl-peptidase